MPTSNEFRTVNNIKLAQLRARKNSFLITQVMKEFGRHICPRELIDYVCKVTKSKREEVRQELMLSIESAVTLAFLKLSENPCYVDFENFNNAQFNESDIMIFKALQFVGIPARAQDIIEFLARRTNMDRASIAQRVYFTLDCAVYFGYLTVSAGYYYVNFDGLYFYCPKLLVSMKKRGGLRVCQPKGRLPYSNIMVKNNKGLLDQPAATNEGNVRRAIPSIAPRPGVQTAAARTVTNVASRNLPSVRTRAIKKAAPITSTKAVPSTARRAVRSASLKSLPSVGTSVTLSAKPSATTRTLPSVVPRTVPNPAPRAVPKAAPRAVPNAAPRAVPDAIPRAVPTAAPRDEPSAVPSVLLSAEPNASAQDVRKRVVLSCVPNVLAKTVPKSATRTVKRFMPRIVTEKRSEIAMHQRKQRFSYSEAKAFWLRSD